MPQFYKAGSSSGPGRLGLAGNIHHEWLVGGGQVGEGGLVHRVTLEIEGEESSFLGARSEGRIVSWGGRGKERKCLR